MYREDRVEEVCETDAMRLGDKTKQRAVGVEAPWASDLNDLQALLVVSIEDLIRDPAFGPAIHECYRIGSVPRQANDSDDGVGQYAPDDRAGLQIFKFQ